jgi:formylglycine-generating enzyme required for sulfatase activity
MAAWLLLATAALEAADRQSMTRVMERKTLAGRAKIEIALAGNRLPSDTADRAPKDPDARDDPPRTIDNKIGMTLVLIPAGEFLMGSPAADKDAGETEKPQHRVRITRPFYLATTEVTRGQFRKVAESSGYQTEAERPGKGALGWDARTRRFERNRRYTWRSPGFEQTDDHPVVCVSWNDAIATCNALSKLDGLEPYYQFGPGAQSRGDGYRLPTEAEWEYACRGGTTTRYWSGDDPETLASVGNIADGTLKAQLSWQTTIAARDGHTFTAPVGRFRPNAFGLCDTHGNVCEWCWDGYDKEYYGRSPSIDPIGTSRAGLRVLRGGSWGSRPRSARSADRDWSTPDDRALDLGFRVARNLPER